MLVQIRDLSADVSLTLDLSLAILRAPFSGGKIQKPRGQFGTNGGEVNAVNAAVLGS